jgi:putative nucleotidyltransferase with HDIG domain
VSEALREALGSIGEGWLVGGAVRDRLLGRETVDYDVVVAGDPEQAARSVGRAAGGHPFALSDAFGAWRVVAREGDWQLDVMPLTGETLEEDLLRRDFTVNAIAEPLGGGALVDPTGGRSDLEARRLRMVAAAAFTEDPLRALRLARIACELDFAADAATVTAARERVAGLALVSAERVFAELKRVVASSRVLFGLELMEQTGVTQIVLPELLALRGVEQSHFHHLDVHDHTLAVVAEAIALQDDPLVLGPAAGAVAALMAEPLADGLTRWEAVRLGALLHDVAKPQTRAVTADGRVTFMGHDEAGASVASTVLGRLRASEKLREHVAGLARHHLRLGFLVHEMPLGRRDLYRYLEATAPLQVDVTVLSVADRLATRGEKADAAIAKHVELASSLLADALAWRASPPAPPIRGDELAAALGIKPGPELGRLLTALTEAAYAGEVSDADGAVRLARTLL